MQASFSQALAHLEARLGVQFRLQQNGNYKGPCPACEAGNPKGHHLYARPGTKAPVVLYCARGCTWAAIRQAGELDQLKEKDRPMSAAPRRLDYEHPDFRFDYTTRDGALDVQVLRWGRGVGKEVKQRRPVAGGWAYQLNGYKPGLFHLHKLVALPPGALVLLPEGEPDVLALEALGFAATTSIRGTSGWEAGYTADLLGFRVAICPDHDEPGVKLARQRLADCEAAGIEAAIVWFDFPVTPDHGLDVSDWLGTHDRQDLAVRINLAFQHMLHEPPVVAADPEAAPPRYRFLSVAELLALPPPEWAIEGVLEQREIAVLYGLYGSGKTFLLTDMVCCLASGRPWCGRTVAPMRVLYINADGGAGFAKRVRVWQQVHQIELGPRLVICNEPVNLFDPEGVGELIRQAEDEFGMIVVDTLAECMAGADEINTRDMGLVTGSMRRVIKEAGAGLLVAHHATKDGKGFRGNMTIPNKAGTVFAISRPEKGGPIVMSPEKQRNWTLGEPLAFSLKPVEDSCVLVQEGGRYVAPSGPQITDRQVLKAAVAEPGLTARAMMAKLQLGETTLYDSAKRLAAAGFVTLSVTEGELVRNRKPKGIFPTAAGAHEVSG